MVIIDGVFQGNRGRFGIIVRSTDSFATWFHTTHSNHGMIVVSLSNQ